MYISCHHILCGDKEIELKKGEIMSTEQENKNLLVKTKETIGGCIVIIIFLGLLVKGCPELIKLGEKEGNEILDAGNVLWKAGEQAKAVAKWKSILIDEKTPFRESRADIPIIFQRAIEFEFKRGNVVQAKTFIKKALQEYNIPLKFKSESLKNLVAEAKSEIKEEERTARIDFTIRTFQSLQSVAWEIAEAVYKAAQDSEKEIAIISVYIEGENLTDNYGNPVDGNPKMGTITIDDLIEVRKYRNLDAYRYNEYIHEVYKHQVNSMPYANLINGNN